MPLQAVDAATPVKVYSNLKYRTAALAGFAYAILILIIWGAFNPHSGLPYETAFPYMSETSSVLGGFLYTADPLRIHTNTFYHLSYLLSEALGVQGSYVPFQVVYAILWWARGFLVFLILRRFLPRCLSVCYVAGALVLVHSSDQALQWLGQMNQFGFIFWTALAFYLLTLGVESAQRGLAMLLVFGACFCEYMSLWSYESQLPLLLALPLLLLLRSRQWRKLSAVYAAWYIVPLVYLWLTFARYTDAATQSYQKSVMRKDLAVGSLLADWLFNIRASLEFWTWPQNVWTIPVNELALAGIAAAVFFACGLGFVYLTNEARRPNPFVERVGAWCALLGVGLACVALSFPIYLLLESARGLWRTQMLSGMGAGLVLTALAVLASHALSRPSARLGLLLGIGAIITFYGSASALQKSANHRVVWERHRAVIKELLQVAPSVRPNTIVVVVNVPKNPDPLGHNMWLDLALRLMYPGTPVAGVYFYTDGTPGLGNNLKAEGDAWKWDQTGLPGIVRMASLANTVVVDYEASGQGKLEAQLPPFACETRCATELYHAGSMITGTVSPIAVRRFLQ